VKLIFAGWLWVAAITLSGCAAIMTASGPAVMTAVTGKAYENRSTVAQLIDAKIHARILLYLTNIQSDLLVTVNTDIWQGHVLFTGMLNNAKLRDRIVKYARSDKHVQTVYNHIQIVSKQFKEKQRQGRENRSVSKSITDAWISAKVKVRLLAMYNVKSVNYRWQTALAQVYIIGTASSRAERDLVLRAIHATKGVRGVTSYIGILKKPPNK